MVNNINTYLTKVGLRVGKSRKGIIQQIYGAGKGVGQMLVAAIKGDKERIKELKKSVKASDFSEFILNLDAIAFGALNFPIKVVELATGWKLSINYNNQIRNVISIIKK